MKPKFVDLYEAGVNLSIKNGLKVFKRKYKTKFTGKNYIPYVAPEGYNNLYQRVSPEEIMVIRNVFRSNDCPSMSRYVYYLDGQEDMAVKLLRECVDKVITTQAEDACRMRDIWINRK